MCNTTYLHGHTTQLYCQEASTQERFIFYTVEPALSSHVEVVKIVSKSTSFRRLHQMLLPT